MSNKQKIREEIIAVREKLSYNDVLLRSIKVIKRLVDSDFFVDSKCVFSYLSFRNEVDTLQLIKDKMSSVNFVVPCVIEGEMTVVRFNGFADLVEGNYGILEPGKKEKVDLDSIDLVIVPGVAFDREGNRIGFGKGYYDKILDSINAVKVGICFDFQVVDRIENEEHDVRMDYVVSENELIKTD